MEALDGAADSPCHPEDGPSRAQQRMQALVRVCERSLAGVGSTRPRPRLVATFEARDEDSMRLLWSLCGRSPRLSRVAKETLQCDATVVPVVFDGAHPAAVGEEKPTFTEKVRTAIVARDRRCRFCLRAPAAWCDAHHIIPGAGRTANDGCLLCRVCHRRVHRFKWRLELRDDGVIEFSRRGERFLSLPP